VLILGVVVFSLIHIIIPFIQEKFFPSVGDNVLPTQSAAPIEDLTSKTREVLLTGGNTSIGDPVMLGDDIFFAGGKDAQGNNLYAINVHNTMTRKTEVIPGIRAKNDCILSIDVSADHIVYFDSKNSGGGNIYAYNRETEKITELMRISYGWPEVAIAGEYAVWMERTGNVTEKLYVMHIETQELTTLAVFEDSPFGLSHPGTHKGEIVWAEADPERTEDATQGVLKILALDGTMAEPETYFPEMFVYSPVTNGSARAWIDSSLDDGAGLYLSVDGTRPKKIADGVQDYGLGNNFLAYSRGGAIWAYFYEDDRLARLSTVGEYCYLGCVSSHGVAWFDISDTTRERDILKYAVLD